MPLKNTSLLAITLVVAPWAVACGSKAKESTTPAKTQTAKADPAPVKDEAPAQDPVSLETKNDLGLGETIYFEFDSSTLGSESRDILENNAEWLKEDGARSLTIEGHTDEAGTSEYNIALGDRRARAAKEYIVALGIDASRIRIISFGEERPAISGDDAKNRRGMFIATKK